MRTKAPFVILLLLLVSCSQKPPTLELKRSENSVRAMGQLIDFYSRNAFESSSGAYYSEVDNEGRVLSDKVYTVALSRLIYGLAYSSAHFPENLTKAQRALEYQLEHMLAEDEFGPYFLSWVTPTKKSGSTHIDIWQQAYGLCGMVELYRQTQDKALLVQIHRLHSALVRRFQDQTHQGFYGQYELGVGPVPGSKSLQSLMYPITAYLANLWLADEAHRALYQPILKEHVELLYGVGWDHELEWVNVKFSDSWKACENSLETICSTVSPGHNFQLAALLLRASDWPFMPKQQRRSLSKRGKSIVAATLNKPIYGPQGVQGGFAQTFNPLTQSATDTRKAWWQHCEAIIALSLIEGRESMRDELAQYFFSHFQDSKFGGEYFLLDTNDRPITSDPKGSMGKSAYHTIEMIRFL